MGFQLVGVDWVTFLKQLVVYVVSNINVSLKRCRRVHKKRYELPKYYNVRWAYDLPQNELAIQTEYGNLV